MEERYLKALTNRVTLKDWRLIVDKALEQALDGDDKARRWLGEYLIGKPAERLAGVQGDAVEVVNYTPEQWAAEWERRAQQADEALALFDDEDQDA